MNKELYRLNNITSWTIEELEQRLEAIYADCVEMYGPVKGNYFTESWQDNKEIKQGAYGREIHHKYEYYKANLDICSLSDKITAQMYPYEFQEAKNLVYCNWFQHCIIHIIIDRLRQIQYGKYRPGMLENRVGLITGYINEEFTPKSNYHQQALKVFDDFSIFELFHDAMSEWSSFTHIDWLVLGYETSSFDNVAFDLE